jgi:hypothetical protein
MPPLSSSVGCETVVLAVLLAALASTNPAEAGWEHRLRLSCDEHFSSWDVTAPPKNAEQLLASTSLFGESRESVRWYHGNGLAACLRKPPTSAFRCNSLLVVHFAREGDETVIYDEPWVFCPPAPPRT